MPFLTKPVDLAVARIEGGEKSGRTGAFVVMRHGVRLRRFSGSPG